MSVGITQRISPHLKNPSPIPCKVSRCVRAGWRPVVLVGRSIVHPIRCTDRFILAAHTVMATVKDKVPDPIIPSDASCLFKPGSQIVRDLAKDGNLSPDDLLFATGTHMTGNIADEALLRSIVKDSLPQSPRLHKVLRADLREEADGLARKFAVCLVDVDAAGVELDGLDGGEIVRSRALVVEGHGPVTLEVCRVVTGLWSIDGKLLVVCADAVSVGVGVGKQATLQDGIRRGLDAYQQ